MRIEIGKGKRITKKKKKKKRLLLVCIVPAT